MPRCVYSHCIHLTTAALCLPLALQREPQKPDRSVWCGRGSIVSITVHRTRIQLLNYIAFICFSKKTRLMQSRWVCACPSIHPSHSSSWASCLALIKAGRRSETSTSSSASHWEAKHLVWGESDLMACPTKKKGGSPGSPLVSKGSSMSHKTRRNQKLCQACSLQEWLSCGLLQSSFLKA